MDAKRNPNVYPLCKKPEISPRIVLGVDSIVIDDPLAHSPPANNPCANLRTINKIGAIIPALFHVGNNPVRNVIADIPVIVTIIAFFRPCRSPKLPNRAPPRGLIINATV